MNHHLTKAEKLKQLNQLNNNTLMQTLGIVYTDVDDDYITATMPVNKNVHQPYGLLHGGATIALAETVGSVLSALSLEPKSHKVVGMHVSSNHLKPISNGIVTATASFVKKGKTTHLVEINVTDEQGQLINKTMLTNAVILA